MKKTPTVLSIIFIMLLMLPLALIGWFIAWISGVTFLFPLIVVLYISFGVFLTVRFFKLIDHKKILYRTTWVAIAVCLIYTIPGIYGKTRPIIQDGYVDTYYYAPFSENSKVVTLPEPSTYKIEDYIPVIDGATALYPVYSAFAQAVYPEKKYDQYGAK